LADKTRAISICADKCTVLSFALMASISETLALSSREAVLRQSTEDLKILQRAA
jgi:hypothetical protein